MTLIETIKDRVSIEDVLRNCGIPYRRNRCCCPIHGGDNPNSFSFTENRYHCFACGSSGDVIDLTQYLAKTDLPGAIDCLCGLAGIENTLRHRQTVAPLPRPVPQQQEETSNKDQIRAEITRLSLSRRMWTHEQQLLRDRFKAGRISEVEYWTQVYRLDWHLAELDAQAIRLHYELRHQ